MTTTETAATPTDSYPGAYVPEILTQWAAARELHAPVKRWITDELDEHSWISLDELLTYYGLADVDAAQAEGFEVQHFTICSECGRAEAQTHLDDDEWSYLAAIWPCATARALGAPAE